MTGRPRQPPPRRATSGPRAVLLLAALGALPAAGCAARGHDHLAKGDRFLADGRVDDAYAEYRIALRRDPRPPTELLWKLGLLDLDARNVTRARTELTALVERDPDSRERVVRAYLLFAARWFQAGDPFHATQALEAARALDPELVLGPFHYAVADHYFEQLDDERAAEHYLLGLATAPGMDPEAAYRLALVFERLGRWERAAAYHRRYAETGGDRAAGREARYHLGEAAFRAGREHFLAHRYAAAAAELETVLRLGLPEPRLDDAWYLVGEIRYRSGELAGAAAAFERVLELAPSSSSRVYGEAERRLLDIRFGAAGGAT